MNLLSEVKKISTKARSCGRKHLRDKAPNSEHPITSKSQLPKIQKLGLNCFGHWMVLGICLECGTCHLEFETRS